MSQGSIVETILPPLAFIVLIAAYCAAVATVRGMGRPTETHNGPSARSRAAPETWLVSTAGVVAATASEYGSQMQHVTHGMTR